MKRKRCHYSSAEKDAILRRQLIVLEDVSVVCDELNLNSPLLYDWQKQFFDGGAKAFDNDGCNKETKSKREKPRL